MPLGYPAGTGRGAPLGRVGTPITTRRNPMRRRYVAALAALALAGSVAAATPAYASGGNGHGHGHSCAESFHAAVVEDNEAYNAKDADRYEAILNPRMIFWQDGVATYGRDAIMANARAAFATPNWSWIYDIESETVHGCDSGLAVASARFVRPSTNTDALFQFTMYLVREHGKWTVAADNVHLASS
jgi:hypothetical protein